MKVDAKNMKWTRAPKQYAITEDKVEMITEPHTDLWQRTYYHFRNDNAPVLQMATDEKYFSFVVNTEFDTKVRYDQSGIAKVMRYELQRRGIKKLKVVYSKEPPLTPIDDMAISCRAHCICPPGIARKCTKRRQVSDSNAFVPSVVGIIIAGEAIKELAQKN